MGTNIAHLFTRNGEFRIESVGEKDNVGVARNVVKADKLQGEFDLRVNVSYLGKVADVIREGPLNYSCSEARKPLYFTTADFQAVLMPIYVEDKKATQADPQSFEPAGTATESVPT
jgi:hypothetical protein